MRTPARLLSAAAAALLLAAVGGGQVRRVPAMPPEIVLPDDPPVRLTVELDNEQLRVVRIKLAAYSRARQLLADSHGVLLVAVTPVDLRIASGTRDTHLAAGLTQWISDAGGAVQNLGPEACEFLLIVAKR